MESLCEIGIVERIKYNQIPRIIWTFWHTNSIPLIVKRCIASWKRIHPDWSIHIVQPQNLATFVDVNMDIPGITLENETPQKRSNVIRFVLLYKYGGFWLDATTLLTRPGLSHVVESFTDWYGFGVEINCMASSPKGYVVTILKNEVVKFMQWHPLETRMRKIKEVYNVTHGYFYTQLIIETLLETNPGLKYIMKKNARLNAWNTIYSFWEAAIRTGEKEEKWKSKLDVIRFMFKENNKDKIPDSVYKNSIHKLQGAKSIIQYSEIPNDCWFARLEKKSFIE